MEYLSQKGFKQVLEKISELDPNIKSFGWGQLYDVNGDPKVKQEYTGMFVNPISTTVLEWVLLREYQILIYDVPFQNNGSDNELDIISDSEEIALRIIRYLKNADDVFYPNGNPTIQPFSDKFFDKVSGVIINITLEFNKVVSDCDDPDYTFNMIKNNI